MTSQSDQFPKLKIEADLDFTAAPTEAVGVALKQLNAVAHNGIVAVVTMGLICVWAKGQLKHGEVGAWRDSLSAWELSPSTIHRYEAAARRFLKLQEDEEEYRAAWDDAKRIYKTGKEWAIAGVLANAILSNKPTKRESEHRAWVSAFLAGKRRTQLYFHSNNPALLTDDEAEAREKCEKHFLDHPEDDDYYRPLIENEDYTWAKAWKGIQGKLASEDAEESSGGGKRRADPNYGQLFVRASKTILTGFSGGHWHGLPVDVKAQVVENLKHFWQSMPAEVRTEVLTSGKKGAKA